MRCREFLAEYTSLIPRHELLWLLAHYTGESKSRIQLENPELSPETAERVRAAALRRAEGEPLQYICGLQPFWDFELIVSPAVLIPRWDSEAVLEQALRLLPPDKPLQAADICTGSGAYALTLKQERPLTEVCACDISPEALDIARQNAAKYRLAIDFRQGDLLAALPEGKRYDLIVSNPPYVAAGADLPPDVRREPALALFGGVDGLDFYRRLIRENVAAYLKPGGYLLLEIGSDQREAVCQMLAEAGFKDVRAGQDLAGLDRWVQAARR